ncbi:MAG TPA: L,D-transpeptidase family protein, partial [Hyphomicrobiaceae bacterium]|nr:L,D-transpeptidase family protein [Hyphomicrobiaceae bacterium]
PAASPLPSAEPATPPASTAANAVAQPLGTEASAPPAPPASSATPAAAEAPPPAPVDPVLAEVRRQLAEPAKGNVDRGDRTQLTSFYAERNDPPLWVSAGGFTAKANHLMAEIRRADDWGLSASAFELPHLPAGTTAADALAAAEVKLSLAALKYARHARGGRLDPALISKNIDVKLTFRDPKVLMQSLAASDAPGNVLRDLNPKHEQFQKLRQALLKARGGHATSEPAKVETRGMHLPDGPPLYLGSEHPNVALLRQRLGLPQPRGAEAIFDLEVQAALKAFQQQNGIQPTGILTPKTRAVLNSGVKAERPTMPAGTDVQRIIVNMERWRWLPEHLGDLHVEDNLPEFVTRVIKKGHVIHSAKIVVGKVDTPTAVFSANMRFVVFHPEWNVPDSIKVKELAPYLSSGGGGFFFGGGDTSILDRQRLRVVYNGHTINPSSVDWGQVDVRRFAFVQSAGPHNVLGVVKFMFPNKHDIYMHDTPQRELFEQTRRTFSHGCMRVQNPEHLAELILAEDKGWSSEQVRGLLAQGYNNEVQLTHEIPVHVTYFTAVVGEGGQLSYYGDIYGYDSRMSAALGGRPLPPEVVASSDEPPRDPRRGRPQKQSDFFSGLFGN